MTAELISEINRRLHKSLTKDPNTLTCIVTGKTRATNTAYLQSKAVNAGSIERFVQHYLCREALTLLKAGNTVLQVREQLDVDPSVPIPTIETIETALAVNGK
jgi:hypothetical protein